MNLNKKVLLLMFVFTACLFLHFAQADTAYIGDDIYTYSTLDDNTLIITGFSDEGETTSELIFPDTINGKPVTKLGPKIFSGKYYPLSITLPKHLAEVNVNTFSYNSKNVRKIIIPEEYSFQENFFHYFENLIEFEVLGNNSEYATINGVLYYKPEKNWYVIQEVKKTSILTSHKE